MKTRIIPVVDLFAGPGGLGEGFSTFEKKGISGLFKIAISIEKDFHAHQTLELRSFFRQFAKENVHEDYYLYLRQELDRESLFQRHPREAQHAKEEARHLELGRDNDEIYRLVGERLELANNPDWLLIGGPPCQAYSVVGRSRMRNQDPKSFEEDPRHTLYREYLNILARFQPAVFVMENVRGILSSRLGGELIFPKILSDLRRPSKALELKGPCRDYTIYSLVVESEGKELQPTDYIIRSEAYGIPQMRHRVILLGVRSDFAERPRLLIPQLKPVTTSKLLSDLPRLRSELSKHPTARDKNWAGYLRESVTRAWFREIEEDGATDSQKAKLAERIKKAVCELDDDLSCGCEFFAPVNSKIDPYNKAWYFDPRLGGYCNHVARTHMPEDLHRYLYAACFADVYGYSPTMRDFPTALLPLHKNVRQKLNERVNDEMFEDRFRVQVSSRPAHTIASHISKDGHYNIHFDPVQCRSLTVREAARLQTFPDNYKFEGPRTEQYQQVGNAVPPLLARQIAEVVYDILSKKAMP